MPSKQKWIIITNGNEPLDKISGELKQKGFAVESTLDSIGQIIADGTEEMKKEALKIKGINSIVASHEDINIGPPDSDITW